MRPACPPTATDRAPSAVTIPPAGASAGAGAGAGVGVGVGVCVGDWARWREATERTRPTRPMTAPTMLATLSAFSKSPAITRAPSPAAARPPSTATPHTMVLARLVIRSSFHRAAPPGVLPPKWGPNPGSPASVRRTLCSVPSGGPLTGTGPTEPAGPTPPAGPTAPGVRAEAERAAAVGGNAQDVITGDGNTVIRNRNTTVVVHREPPRPEPPPEQAVTRAVADYARRFAQEYGGLDLDVLAPPKERHLAVPLSEVFVAPSVRADPPPLELPRELRRRLASSGELPEEDLLPPGVERADIERLRNSYLERPEEHVLEVLAGPSGGRTVLLGDPGAGKSTLVRHLVLALTAGGPEVPDGPLGALAGRVPLVVELRRYADDPWRHGGFEEFLDRQHQDFGLSVPGPVRERLLSEGRALVVFDGLDEVCDPKAREETARRIAAFAAHRPSARIVVTSRIIGYRRGTLERAHFSHFTLQDLDQERIDAFVRRWYRHACPGDPARAAELAERLTSGVEDSRPLREMAGNPLLLTILVIIGARGPLPGNRRGVYEHAVAVLVEQWDQAAKFLKTPLVPPVAEALDALGAEERLALLRRLARTLQEGRGGIAGNHIRARDLERFFRDHLEDQYGVAPPHAASAARAMVTQLHERNFILSRYGGDVYGFVHRAFLEHLAAADIAHRYREEAEWTPEELIEQVVAARVAHPAWHEVLLLLIGQLGAQDATAAIDRLLGLHARRTDPDDASHVVLALRALAETGGRGVPADRSVAVVDAVTTVLDVRGSKGPWLLDEGASALGSFGRYSAARARYLRWYRLSGQFSVSGEPAGLLAFHLRLDEDELIPLARGSFHSIDRTLLLYALGRRRPDDEVRALVVREASENPDGGLGFMALEVLGELWADREDVRAFLAGRAAEDPDHHGRSTALEALAAGRPDDEAVRDLVMGAATGDDHQFARSDALRLLGRRWSGDASVRALLIRRAREDPEGNTRSEALQTLARYACGHPDVLGFLTRSAADDGAPDLSRAAVWNLGRQVPGNAAVRELLIGRAADSPHSDVRTAALGALGRHGPGHTTVREALLRAAAADPWPEARSTALRELGEHWPGHEGVREAVLRRAGEDPDPGVRLTAVQVMGDCYPGDDEVREVLTGCCTASAAGHEDVGHEDVGQEDVRQGALRALARHWAARPEVRDLLVRVCADEPDAYTYATVLCGLAEHWPGRRDVHELLLTAADHPDRTTCSTVLDVLEDHWPDHEDVRAVLMRVAAGAADDLLVAGAALKVLTKRWTDRPDVGEFVRGVASDTSHPCQGTVLTALGGHWAHRDDVREVLARAVAGHPEERTRAEAVRTLGRRWAGHPDVHALLRRCAEADPAPEVRFAALRWWVVRAGDEEGDALVGARAVAEPDPQVRRKVRHMLALSRPGVPRPGEAEEVR
ncbi:HEAT repeat domain-containing protein [Streptomyces sp. ICC1]|uniref:HEAT repeat domain-containing protein n=1 Tax=Streptomyces sp. ICC1 TaxID=2099583 RepID=UPI0031B9F886